MVNTENNKNVKLKKLKIKDKIIIILICCLIIVGPIIFNNYNKIKGQNKHIASEYSANLHTQVLLADKNIKYRKDEKVSYNDIYIYFYADDIYTEKNYGNGYIKIDKNKNVDVSADTEKLKDLLLKVKYYNH